MTAAAPPGLRFGEWTDVRQFRAWRDAFARPCLDAYAAAGHMTAAERVADGGFLNTADGLLYRVGSGSVLTGPHGYALSANFTRHSTSPRSANGAWGRYVNHFYSYTVPGYRGLGYASALLAAAEAAARAAGYDRLKSLAGTFGGFRLHYRAGHDFWGVVPTGEIQVDTPLSRATPFPAGVPRYARAAARAPGRPREQPMGPGELIAVLTDPAGRFRVPPAAARAALEPKGP